MNTGTEILLRCAEADRQNRQLTDLSRKLSNQIVDAAWFRNFGRECGAKRARKLRRKGRSVKFLRRTCTGKARYTWLPCIHSIHVEPVDMGPNTNAMRIWYE